MNQDSTIAINFAVQGAANAASEANKVAASLKNVAAAGEASAAYGKGLDATLSALHEAANAGRAADEANKGLVSTLAGSAAKLLAFGGGLAALKLGFDEFAEGEKAGVVLRKFGVDAEEAGQQAETLAQLEMFTGDRISAAQIYGQVINGHVRVLKQYGIELAENSTRLQRLNALHDLGARGLGSQAEKAQTVTGQFAILGKETGDLVAQMLSAGTEGANLANVLDWIRSTAFDTPNAFELAAQAAEAKAQSDIRAAQAAKANALANEEQKRALDGVAAAAMEAANAVRVVGEMQDKAARDGRARAAAADAQHAEELARIAEDELDGKITPREADAKRSMAGADAGVRSAQDKLNANADSRGFNRALSSTNAEKLKQAEEAAAGITDEKERKKADAEVQKLRDQQRSIDDKQAELETQGQEATSGLGTAYNKRRETIAQLTMKEREEKRREAEKNAPKKPDFSSLRAAQDLLDQKAAEQGTNERPIVEGGVGGMVPRNSLANQPGGGLSAAMKEVQAASKSNDTEVVALCKQILADKKVTQGELKSLREQIRSLQEDASK